MVQLAAGRCHSYYPTRPGLHSYQALSEINNVAISIYFQPQLVTTELNLKRFYRFSLPTDLHYDVDG